MNSSNTSLAHTVEHGLELLPKYNADGLITAVVQEQSSGEILMLAHMNDQALQMTVETGKATFWSRSRQELWVKGETSGNRLQVSEVLIDCDQDAVVVKASLEGIGACHTGARSCFYRKIKLDDHELKLKKL